MSNFFNPLDAVFKNEPSSEKLESNSKAMSNDTHGVCPKCKNNMEMVGLSSSEKAYWCTRCRVSSPLPKN